MPPDPFSSMWDEACDLLDRVERLQRQFFRRARSPLGHPIWQPPIDIFETPKGLSVLVAMPGVAPKQVQVILDTGALVVRGERTLPEFAERGYIRRLEIPHGWFERRIDLPPGHYELDRQELQHGCLVLLLHKLG
jgi:HSP20 family protein